ncbi:MAG: hypothetical protein NTZ07_02690 [Candidatus Woesebacteria bacterium]|nr:hypothetical protein [Candidatus Woesebacteria bacterium]
MTNLERWVSCEIHEDGSWEFTKPSPWLKYYIAHLASVYGIPQKEILEKCFLEGIAMAYIEEAEKGRVEIIKRELPGRSEKPVVVFGKK